MVDHADGSDHRVEREDRIQHHNLRHHAPEARAASLGRIIAVFPLQPLVELHRGFKKQEEAADQHNEVAGAEGEITDAE